jgi:glycosyltransferase involved in cell wall biosynthesis
MISVVIPAYNEEKCISSCLEALTKQTTTENIEVILVDNHSTDNTINQASTFLHRLNLTILSESHKGRSPARRLGFSRAKSEIIFSTDADTIVPATWIESILPSFKDPKTAAVTGPVKINDCFVLSNLLFNFCQPLAMHAYKVFFGHYWLNGSNFAIRQTIYHKSGGFDKQLVEIEDINLSEKVSRFGHIKMIDVPVKTSGRRFTKKGVLNGFSVYANSFWHYLRGKTHAVILNDVR